MRRSAILGSLLFLTLSFAISCTQPPPIKIGFVGGLTGRYSEMGVIARNTVRMLVEEVNAEGGIKGRNLELLSRDDFNDPEKCEKAIRELIDAKVLAIVGPLFSSMAKAALRAIEGQDVLMISPSMTTEYLSGRDDNFLRTTSGSGGLGTTLADRMAGQGHATVAVAYDLGNRIYTEEILKLFRQDIPSKGLRIVHSEAYTSNGDAPIPEIAKRLAASRADAALLIVSGIDGAALAQQLRKQGSDVSLYGVSWAQTNDLLLHGGKAVEGMNLIGIFNDNDIDPALAKVRDNYIKRYNKNPSLIFQRAYNTGLILMEGMRTSKELTPNSIKKSILEKEKFTSVGRDIVFDEYGDVAQQYSIYEIVDGKFRIIK